MFEDLEQLLKQAKKQAHQTKSLQMAQRVALPKPLIRKQAELEWTVGKTVCLIHRSEDGTETALGLFIEHLRNGSRWLRPTADSLSPDHCEIVTGSWWLHPSICEISVDSPHEVLAIRARFEMLIQEFVDENYLPPLDFNALERPLEDEDEDLDEDEDDDYDYDEDEDEDE